MHRTTRGILTVACACLLTACGAKHAGVAKAPDGARAQQTQKPGAAKGETSPEAVFVQEGIAGWFGKDFYGNEVKKGDKYDIHALTAVHRTLPLGILVKVRNMENGQEVVVRVNDRGPFAKGRVMDLSYAAAKTIGIGEQGSVAVRIEALGSRTMDTSGRESYKQPASFDAGTYTVQIGMFKNTQNPKRISEEMRRLFGYSEVREIHAKGERLFRVFAGKYTSLKEAETAQRNFTEHGYPASFVLSLE